MVNTLKFIRDHVKPALGEVEAVSGYRNPALNACARGTGPQRPSRLFRARPGPGPPARPARAVPPALRHPCCLRRPLRRAGLGFYTFQRFHIDTRSFRRWGSAGPQGNESPCAVIERGGDPLAPPIGQPVTTTSLPIRTPPRPAPTPYRPVPTTPAGARALPAAPTTRRRRVRRPIQPAAAASDPAAADDTQSVTPVLPVGEAHGEGDRANAGGGAC